MGKKTSLLKVTAINAAGLGVALLAGEIVLRITKPEALEARLAMNKQLREGTQQSQSLFEKEYFHFKPNSKGEQFHSEYQHSSQHDQYGWRNPCFDPSKPATAIIIGDSYTYGIGVSDADLLQCQAKNFDPNSNIYAMGIPGAAITQYLRILNTHSGLIHNLRPSSKTVNLALCMGNDFEDLIAYGIPNADKNGAPIVAMPQFQQSGLKQAMSNINTTLMQQAWIADLRLAQALKLVVMQNSKIKDHGNFYSNYGGQTLYKKNSPDQTSALTRALNKLKEDFSKAGFKLGSLVLIPDGTEVSKERLERDSQLGGFQSSDINSSYKFDGMLNACKNANLKCIDFRDKLKGDDYYVFDGHFRPSGVKVMTESIVNQLQ